MSHKEKSLSFFIGKLAKLIVHCGYSSVYQFVYHFFAFIFVRVAFVSYQSELLKFREEVYVLVNSYQAVMI